MIISPTGDQKRLFIASFIQLSGLLYKVHSLGNSPYFGQLRLGLSLVLVLNLYAHTLQIR
jgi:hypothetical protein